MASPCEVHVDDVDRDQARAIVDVAAREAARIEAKFSRYRHGNLIHAINTAGGRPVVVDDETARLLDYAARLHELSGGKFDVTSGVLRRAWRFDGSDRAGGTWSVGARPSSRSSRAWRSISVELARNTPSIEPRHSCGGYRRDVC
jgi:thiamine biosynthesis lipoprotein ApbE